MSNDPLPGVMTPASLSVMTPQTFIPAPFTLGQRVTVYSPDSWINLVEGVVVALPHRGGLLAVQIDGDTPIGPSPVRWMDPRRVAPVFTCDTCRLGCDCDGAKGDPGCGHYGCWGRGDGQTAVHCPDTEVGRARAAAFTSARGWA